MMSNPPNHSHFPPGYRICIGREDEENSQFQHRFGASLQTMPTCCNCNQPMHLLFLFNLSDPRLAFISLPNAHQLPMVSCLSCTSVYERQYFALREGGSVVEVVNQPFGEVIGEFLPRPLKQHPISLRPLRDDEYPVDEETWYALLDNPEPKHQVGGSPLWLQQPEELQCPSCGKSMEFVAMFNDDTDIDTGVDPQGIYLADSAILYLFYCQDCVILGTTFQSA
jgi:hypothetical protein